MTLKVEPPAGVAIPQRELDFCGPCTIIVLDAMGVTGPTIDYYRDRMASLAPVSPPE